VPRAGKILLAMAFSHLLQIRPGEIGRVRKMAGQRLPTTGIFCRAMRQMLPPRHRRPASAIG
jgi:hypothetical protein